MPFLCVRSRVRQIFVVLWSCLSIGWAEVAVAPGKGTEQVRQLNNQVLALHARMQEAGGEEAAALRAEAARTLRARAGQLSRLIEADPKQALAFAFSAGLLVDLAAKFPESASLLESHGTWEGTLESWAYDYPGGAHGTVHRLRTGKDVLEVHFAGRAPEGCQSGFTLSVTGVRAGNRVAAESATAAASTTSLSCSTTGAQNTVALLVHFPGTTPPTNVTAASVSSFLFGTTGQSLSGLWQEASYGKTWATGDVFGWFTLSSSYSCQYANSITADAINTAANAGVNFQNYTRVFIIMPDNPCGWSGNGSIGCSLQSSPTGSFNGSISYLYTGYLTSQDEAAMLAGHEGGHNLGLNHASTASWGSQTLGAVGTAPTGWGEYGDWFSGMATTYAAHYAAPHKAEILGWLPSANYQVVQSSGTWTLLPYESAVTGVQALKVERGTGNNAWLWIEYRQPIGIYDSLFNPPVFRGALIHYEDSLTPPLYTELLNFNPSLNNTDYSALGAGQTWTDPYTNLSLTVVSAAPSGLTVTVSYGSGSTCTQANPTVSLSPADPSAAAGAAVNYTVSVTNNDAAACPSSSFSIGSSQPSGWPTSFSAASLSLSPGQTGSTAMTMNVPAGTTPGTYAVNASAANGAVTGTGAANATVTAPSSLSATLSASSSSYSKGQTGAFTVAVSIGTVPVAGASVTFTLTKPSGGAVSKTATTGSNGTARWSYKLTQTGTYSIVAKATYNSESAASNAVSFSVH